MIKAEINTDINDYSIKIYGIIDKEERECFLQNLEDVKKLIEKLMAEDSKEKKEVMDNKYTLDYLIARQIKFKCRDKERVVKEYLGYDMISRITTIGETGIVLEADRSSSRVFLEYAGIDLWYGNDALVLCSSEDEEDK